MNTYQIITKCGVFVRVNAVNTYQAATEARDEGWVVIAVIRLN